jgi:hypothetical protein
VPGPGVATGITSASAGSFSPYSGRFSGRSIYCGYLPPISRGLWSTIMDAVKVVARDTRTHARRWRGLAPRPSVPLKITEIGATAGFLMIAKDFIPEMGAKSFAIMKGGQKCEVGGVPGAVVTRCRVNPAARPAAGAAGTEVSSPGGERPSPGKRSEPDRRPDGQTAGLARVFAFKTPHLSAGFYPQ